MLKFQYYLVFETIKFEKLPYPQVFTCALSQSKDSYIVINNLEEYLKDGKSGLSDEIKPLGSAFILISDDSWQSRINNSKLF
ncbi:hypothetical protein [Flavobacterium sp. 3-210]